MSKYCEDCKQTWPDLTSYCNHNCMKIALGWQGAKITGDLGAQAVKPTPPTFREQANRLADFIPNNTERAILASRIESALKLAAETAHNNAIEQSAVIIEVASNRSELKSLMYLADAIRALAQKDEK